jgi:site-specific recombinase XerD
MIERWKAARMTRKGFNRRKERAIVSSRRQVPLSDAAQTALDALRAVTGDTSKVVPRMTGPSLSRVFSDDITALGLSGSLHSLRHSYGAHLVMAGVPLRTLQVLMGHASFATTERYAHIGEDHLRDQARPVSL